MIPITRAETQEAEEFCNRNRCRCGGGLVVAWLHGSWVKRCAKNLGHSDFEPGQPFDRRPRKAMVESKVDPWGEPVEKGEGNAILGEAMAKTQGSGKGNKKG